MALPTAPLGQLPNLNMPFQIPTYEVRRGRDQVLTAFLAGLVQNLGAQAVDNVMTRDFAEQPAGFWSKLVSGPKMNRAQAEAAATQEFQGAQADLERTLRSNIANTEANLANRNIDARTADAARGRELEQLLAADRNKLAREQMLYEGSLRQTLSEQAARDALTQIEARAAAEAVLGQQARQDDQGFKREMADIEGQQRLAEIAARIGAESATPQGRYYDAQAKALQFSNEIARRQQGGQAGAQSAKEQAVLEYLGKQKEAAQLSAMPFDRAMGEIVGNMVNNDPTLNQPPTLVQPTTQAQPVDPALIEFLNSIRQGKQQLRF